MSSEREKNASEKRLQTYNRSLKLLYVLLLSLTGFVVFAIFANYLVACCVALAVMVAAGWCADVIAAKLDALRVVANATSIKNYQPLTARMLNRTTLITIGAAISVAISFAFMLRVPVVSDNLGQDSVSVGIAFWLLISMALLGVGIHSLSKVMRLERNKRG